MQKIIISAPFGNYLRFQGTTSTLGTYTLNRRAGMFLRLWRILSTVRYNRRSQSWINKLGLPNPGIESLSSAKDCILSIHGFNKAEWRSLALRAEDLDSEAIEFNLSCPNVEGYHCSKMLEEVESAIQSTSIPAIAKLPPVKWMEWGKPLWDMGVRHFHLCNTIPTPGGGLSGKPLMQYSLWAIQDFRKTFGSKAILIGGGGVTCQADVDLYVKTGADHVAIGSMLLNPLNWWSKKFL